MVIRTNNKDIHRYKYKRRGAVLKSKKIRNNKVSFGEIFENIQDFRNRGIISVSSVSISISKAIKKYTDKT